MATKRRRRTTGRRRSKRIGAMSLNPKNPLVLVASVAAGYLASDQIFKVIDKAIPTKDTSATDKTQVNVVSDTVLGGGMAAAGGALALLGKKSMAKTVAGGVMVGAGLKLVAVDRGWVKASVTGFPSVPSVGRTRRRMNGFPSVPSVGFTPAALRGGYSPNRASVSAINGVPDSLRGYTPNRYAARTAGAY